MRIRLRRSVGGFFLVAAVLVCAGGPSAQQQRPNADMQLPGDDMSPGEIQRLFDAYLVMQAQEALGLSEQQYAQFLTRLRTLQQTRRQNQAERGRILQELQRLSNPRVERPPDESLIKDRLQALQELESRSAAELRKAYNAIDEILDVRQQARFRILEEQFERRKLELLLRARQQNRQQRRPPLQ